MKRRAQPFGPSVARWVVSIGGFFLVWELVGLAGVVFAVPPFHDVLAALSSELRSGGLWSATAGTVQVAAIGYGIAAVLGIGIGLGIGLSDTIRAALEPVVNALYSTPTTMFVPVIGIYFGLGLSGRVFLVVAFCIFLIIISTAAGARQVPEAYRELANTVGKGYVPFLVKVVLPSASPYILSGLRISAAKAVAGAIAAELLMSSSDLGLYLSRAAASFDLNRLIAGSVFVTFLGALLAIGGRAVERKLLAWSSA